MASRILFTRAMIVLGLLAVSAALGHGQGPLPLVPQPVPIAPAPVEIPGPVQVTPATVDANSARSPWFVAADFGVLFNTAVQVDRHLYSATERSPVYLSSRAILGYEFDGGGALRLTYRDLTQVNNTTYSDAYSSGSGWWSYNFLDFDYVTPEFALADWWLIRGEAGGRFVFFNTGSKDRSAYSSSRSDADVYAGGPHLGLQSKMLIGDFGWSAYSRLDAAIAFGGGRSEYRSEYKGPYFGDYTPTTYKSSNSISAYFYDVDLQVGLMKEFRLRNCDCFVAFGVEAEWLGTGSLRRHESGTFGYVNVGPFVRFGFTF